MDYMDETISCDDLSKFFERVENEHVEISENDFYHFLNLANRYIFDINRGKRLYNKWFNSEIKETVRKKFNYSCFLCGWSEYELRKTLHCYHIDADKLSKDINNIVPLCEKCHRKTHGDNHDYWEQKIYKKLYDLSYIEKNI